MCVNIYIYIERYVCIIYIYICIYIHIYMYIHIFICIYIYIYVFVFVYVYVNVYVYAYIYISISIMGMWVFWKETHVKMGWDTLKIVCLLAIRTAVAWSRAQGGQQTDSDTSAAEGTATVAVFDATFPLVQFVFTSPKLLSVIPSPQC
jgi:hypothetical protein